MRYIVVTGGVMSGLGKGITAASVGRLLMNRGYKVTAIKIDPYINIDAGLMSPFQHGEVYVLKDRGGEIIWFILTNRIFGFKEIHPPGSGTENSPSRQGEFILPRNVK